MSLSSTVSSSGVRKYTDIWQKVKTTGFCAIRCNRVDTNTIIQGVKKEKTRDKRKPTNKIMTVQVTDIGIEFRLREDISIRNL